MKGLYIQTYGCQMNASDSDRMKAVLAPLNYETVLSPEKADLVLINTCSIRDKAEKKTSSFAYELKKLKQKNSQMLIGVTGCVAQQEKEEIIKELPFVDLVLGPDNIDELPWALNEVQTKKVKKLVRTDFDQDARVWKTKTLINNPGPTAFINVMKGCDHFCSYCIVPWTRGREKSRPIVDILDDVKHLTQQGVKEITFLGQNINTFGKRSNESLSELFYRAHEIKDLKRIRFTTSHPGDLKDDLINCYKDLPKLCSYFHLPVQSGSDRILRAMRRFYTANEYREKALALREARPDIALSTDIIVGFPGETDEDFEATYQLLDEMKYDNVYSFAFSARPGTSAASRKDPVPEPIKATRLHKLQTLARQNSIQEHKKQEGRTLEILIEGLSKRNAQMLTGRSSQNVPVHVEARPEIKAGDIIPVKITEGTLTHLKSEHV